MAGIGFKGNVAATTIVDPQRKIGSKRKGYKNLISIWSGMCQLAYLQFVN